MKLLAPYKIRVIVCALALAALPAMSQETRYCPSFLGVQGAAEPVKRGEITFSPYTHHWSQSPEHKHVVLLALDEQLPGSCSSKAKSTTCLCSGFWLQWWV